jgi:hypothetical protein
LATFILDSHEKRFKEQSAIPVIRRLIMRYITHAFAHRETLERARRWLVAAGFDPGRIEVHAQGAPRLAVAAAPGEAAEVEMIFDVVEQTDPDGFLSFWDLGRNPVKSRLGDHALASAPQAQSATFVVGWRPLDDARDLIQSTTELHLTEAYVERGA